jgi:1-acyl-sn-glycerol-3-phosphate acyltransferase
MRSEKSSDISTQSTVRAPKRFIYRLYLVIAWILTKLLFRVRYIRDPLITREGGPYFVVGNHVSYLDPIFCLLALDKLSIRFVAGIEVTSGKLLKKLLAPLAMIPIKPFRVSYSTTREIIASIRSGWLRAKRRSRRYSIKMPRSF